MPMEVEMLSIIPEEKKITTVHTLDNGAMFHYKMSDRVRRAVKVKDGLQNPAWVDLIGSDAFKVFFNERHGPNCMPLNPSSKSLNLRFNDQSTIADNAPYEPGQLVINRDGDFCVYVAFMLGNDSAKRYLRLHDWSVQGFSDPDFRFGEWSYGYADDAGVWFDLMKYPLS